MRRRTAAQTGIPTPRRCPRKPPTISRRALRFGGLVTVLVVLAAGTGVPTSAGATLDLGLSQVLATASPFERVDAIATFATPPTPSDLTRIRATGARVLPLKVLPMAGVRGTRSQLLAVASLPLPNLVSPHQNRRLRYFLDESVTLIGARDVWTAHGYTGRGTTVAVVDTGVDGLHPDLPHPSKVVQNVKVASDPLGLAEPLVLENLASTDTTSGHGTHAASTAAGLGSASGGRYTGVAPGARLVGIGAGEVTTILHALASFDWILQNQARYGIDVVSNSWGTTGGFDASDPVNIATKTLHDRGMVVVFSAGNEGPGEDTLNPYSVAPWVIGVAAGAKDGATLADFSSRGIPGDPLYQPTITAPGVDIVAARAVTGVITTLAAPQDAELGTDAVRYTTMSGTSMAAPHISGVVALMLEANPTLTPDQVKSALQSTATPMAGYSPHEVGAGFVNAFAAVTAIMSAGVTATG